MHTTTHCKLTCGIVTHKKALHRDAIVRELCAAAVACAVFVALHSAQLHHSGLHISVYIVHKLVHNAAHYAQERLYTEGHHEREQASANFHNNKIYEQTTANSCIPATSLTAKSKYALSQSPPPRASWPIMRYNGTAKITRYHQQQQLAHEHAHHDAVATEAQVQSDEAVPAAPASYRSTQLRSVAAAVTLRAEAYLRSACRERYLCAHGLLLPSANCHIEAACEAALN
eukprot:2984-Heterococcus_DN1.PRE.10